MALTPGTAFSTYEIWPSDTGYALRTDYNASGQPIGQAMDPVVGGTEGAANFAALISKAQAAIANNETFLNLANPTTAQAVAQAQALTRQTNAIIYYLLQQLTGLGSITGT